MEELFSYSAWVAYWNSFVEWLSGNVFVVDNAVQLGVTALALLIAVLVSRRISPWLKSLDGNNALRRVARIVAPLLMPLIWFLIQWVSVSAASTMDWPNRLLASVAGLIAAWIVIRLATQIVKHTVLATFIAWVAWTIAALNILNLLDPVMEILDSAGVSIGGLRISLLTVAQSTLAMAVLITSAVYLTGVLDARISSSRSLSPSLQVLFSKSLKIVLIGLAIIVSLQVVGIDLTALAVFGGAIGLGVGFGLQKIVSNLISGVILLVDKSIKPGDVIAVAGTYGWVTALGGRYVSVVTRDGVEHLIPNETLISERVENWTHTNNRTRLKIDFGVHYRSDVHEVIRVSLEAAAETPRVLDDPRPKCLLLEFGDSSVNFQLRVWIADAHNGVQNVKSAVMLAIWDKFQEHGIEIPYPQRDVHIKSTDQSRQD
ncbi:MAG: mechanosensitive ion channel [Gammaproteobacteria bacterium]|jgi:small-conductance mechanosensitive channel